MIRQLCVLICAALLLASCNSKPDGQFNITVKYTNAHSPVTIGQSESGMPVTKVKKVFLYEVPFGNNSGPIRLDSSEIKENQGTFELEGSGKEEGLYEIEFDNGHIVLLANDGKDINVEIDLSRKDNYYTINGSQAGAEIKDFMATYTDHSLRVNRAFSEMDSLKQFSASDSMVLAATDAKNMRIKELNDYLKKFIADTKHPSVALFALGWSSRSFSKTEFEASLQQAIKTFPQHRALGELKTTYDSQQAQLAEMEKKRREVSSWVGQPAPELELPDANGTTIKLSSFKGKYVLVDFWASWCRPCRDENPNIVNAFNKFKSKNFTILGVSLDQKRPDWLKAIQDDKLDWTHVSDLKYWSSKAVEIYKFDGIPYNVLVDPSGKIVAEGLHGEELEKRLQTLLQ